MGKRYIELELTAPAYWASYIINGDCSAMNDDEIKACDEWVAGEGFGCDEFFITDCGEPYFGSWYNNWGQDGVTGGDLCKYVALYRPLRDQVTRV